MVIDVIRDHILECLKKHGIVLYGEDESEYESEALKFAHNLTVSSDDEPVQVWFTAGILRRNHPSQIILVLSNAYTISFDQDGIEIHLKKDSVKIPYTDEKEFDEVFVAIDNILEDVKIWAIQRVMGRITTNMDKDYILPNG